MAAPGSFSFVPTPEMSFEEQLASPYEVNAGTPFVAR